MKIEPTELELAKFKANSETINNLQQKLVQIRKKLQAYSKRQEQLAQGIRDKVEDCPDVPVSEWDFSQVDWINYEGEVIIPEEKENGS